jgi:cell division inhibitor SepF
MGFMDKIKTLMNAPEEEEFDETEEIGVETTPSSTANFDLFNEYKPISSPVAEKKNKVVNIHATTQLQVILVNPERFADAPSIGDHLNNKRTVVLNLESTPKDVSRRLIDFLSGVAYANNGTLKRVANSTFIITPYNVDIMGDLLIDELENNGLYL